VAQSHRFECIVWGWGFEVRQADGRWQMADGKWQMADGKWQTNQLLFDCVIYWFFCFTDFKGFTFGVSRLAFHVWRFTFGVSHLAFHVWRFTAFIKPVDSGDVAGYIICVK
jgi:hypothetical protein